MSARGTGGVGRLLGAAGLLAVALVTVLVRAEVTAERYALVACRAEREDCRRRREALRAALPSELLRVAEAPTAEGDE